MINSSISNSRCSMTVICIVIETEAQFANLPHHFKIYTRWPHSYRFIFHPAQKYMLQLLLIISAFTFESFYLSFFLSCAYPFQKCFGLFRIHSILHGRILILSVSQQLDQFSRLDHDTVSNILKIRCWKKQTSWMNFKIFNNRIQ